MSLPVINKNLALPVISNIDDIVGGIVGIVKSNNETKVALKQVNAFLELNKGVIVSNLQKDLASIDALKDIQLKLIESGLSPEIIESTTKVCFQSIIEVSKNNPSLER